MLPAPRRAIRPHFAGPARSRSGRRSPGFLPPRSSRPRLSRSLSLRRGPLFADPPRGGPLLPPRLSAGRPFEGPPGRARGGRESLAMGVDPIAGSHRAGSDSFKGVICGPNGPKTYSSPAEAGLECEKSGGVLLSQGLTAQVPSALNGLTSVFGMGTGVTHPLSPPKMCCRCGRNRRPLPAHKLRGERDRPL